METFKFKKAIFEIDAGVLEEFNRRFKTIEKDVFITNDCYGARAKPISLDGYKGYEKDLYWGSVSDYDESMDKYIGDKYESKLTLYKEFMDWVKQNNDNHTIMGRVYCPYSKEEIMQLYFPTLYTLAKREYSLGDFKGARVGYKVKVKDVFKVELKNAPQNHMSQKALDLFFSYWSYDVLDKVTLKDAKDSNLLKVTSEMGTLYYGYGDEVWSNQMYFAPKGFYVKMRKGRVFIPCPVYPALKEDLKVLSEQGEVTTIPFKLPTEDERLVNAIEFGVLDSSLMPKRGTAKAQVVYQIKQIIDSLDGGEDVVNAYDRIKDIIQGDSQL